MRLSDALSPTIHPHDSTKTPFFIRALVVALLLLSPAPGNAAEIGCDLFYTEYPEKMSLMKWERFEERDRVLWPSGRRPTLDVTCRYAFLDGEIVGGDYEKVLAFYRQHHPFLQNLTLRSPGGDVDTAIKIGRLLREYLILARAPTRIPGAAGTIFPEAAISLFPTTVDQDVGQVQHQKPMDFRQAS
jgi:hypothetical protein